MGCEVVPWNSRGALSKRCVLARVSDAQYHPCNVVWGGHAVLARVNAWREGVFYGWWVVAAGLGIAFMGALHSFGFPTFFLPLSQDLGISRAATSIVFSASSLESGLQGPFIGWAIDKFGPRVLLMMGAVLVGIGYILLGLVVHGFTGLMLVYVFALALGFTAGFFQPLIAAFNAWFIRRRSLVNGSMGTGFRLGGFIWAPVAAFLVIHWGWQQTAIAVGVLMMAVVLPLALVVRRSPESMGLRPDGDTGETPSGTARRRVGRAAVDFTVGQALRTPTFWLFTLASVLRTVSGSVIMVHVIPVLVWKGLGQQAAANVYALTAVPMTLAWGFLGDRWPAHRVYAATILFAVGGMAILVFNHQIWMLYVFAVVWGISDAGIPLTFSIMGNFFGRKSFATLRGIQASIFAVASFGAPVFAGAVYDRTESYLYALVPGLIALCVAAPAFYLLPHPREPGAPSQGVGTPQAAG